jgi:hypothetical protein
MGPYLKIDPFQAIPLKRDLWEAMDLPQEGPWVLRDPPALRLVMHGGLQHVDNAWGAAINEPSCNMREPLSNILCLSKKSEN